MAKDDHVARLILQGWLPKMPAYTSADILATAFEQSGPGAAMAQKCISGHCLTAYYTRDARLLSHLASRSPIICYIWSSPFGAESKGALPWNVGLQRFSLPM
jgi:hypothetical protein